jgi:tRNA(Arg) A34 adenosine deaminase TadA
MEVNPTKGLFRLALRAAEKSRNSSFWHCVMILKGGRILSVGVNKDTRHAEIDALRQLGYGKARNTECLSLRFSLTDRLTNAKPCPQCEAALKAAGVKRCLYSMPFNKMEKMNLVQAPQGRTRYADNRNYRVASMRLGWVD